MPAQVIVIIIAVVLGIVILAVLIHMLVGGAKWGISSIVDFFKGPPSPDEKQLINAMKCAYYRCSEGCASNKVKVTWIVEEGEEEKKLRCSDFCKPEWTNTGKPDGKICGDRARAHPVTITLADDIEVTEDTWKDVLKVIDRDVGKLIETADCQSLENRGGNNLYLSASSAECEITCDLYAGSYYLWADTDDLVICDRQL